MHACWKLTNRTISLGEMIETKRENDELLIGNDCFPSFKKMTIMFFIGEGSYCCGINYKAGVSKHLTLIL